MKLTFYDMNVFAVKYGSFLNEKGRSSSVQILQYH